MAGNVLPHSIGGYINRKANERVTREPAFILGMHPWSETSLTIDFITKSFGRITARARGAKRPTSPLRGILSEFTPLLISWKGAGAYKTLTDAEWMGCFIPLTGDAILSGFYLNELLMRLTVREDPEDSVFSAYWGALRVLSGSDTRIPAETALRTFELKLLESAGYGFPSEYEPGWYALRGQELCWVGDHPSENEPCYTAEVLRNIVKLDFSSPDTARDAKTLLRSAISAAAGDKPLHTRRILSELMKL